MAKTMLITGASSGIGKEAAKVFVAEGWNVVATMRSPEKEQDLVPSDNLMLTRLDLQNAGSIQEAVGQTLKKFGRIDLLVNNAGYGQYGLLEEVTPEKIRQQVETNVFGVIELMRFAANHAPAASWHDHQRQLGGRYLWSSRDVNLLRKQVRPGGLQRIRFL
jgi:NAD(P)-dependent dehydrogenase (short-subunit alcohol dehydrogenase family)